MSNYQYDERDGYVQEALEAAEDAALDKATEAAISRAVHHYYETGVYEDPKDPGNTPCFTCCQVECVCDPTEFDLDVEDGRVE